MNKNKEKKMFIFKMVILALMFAIVGRKFYKLMGKEDFTALMQWWFALLVLGAGFMPLSAIVFKNFRDKGWLFSKTIALSVSGWLVWFLSSFKIIKFTNANCFIISGLCIAANVAFLIFAFLKDKKANKELPPAEAKWTYGKLTYDNYFSVVLTEFMFFAGFALWTYLRCFKPELMGNTEKFMDYGLMTSIDRAVYMPAEDMWFSGYGINYYYLGQYFGVFVKRLSGVAIEDAYTLALMMVAGFGFAMPYSIVNQVTSDMVEKRKIGTRAGRAYVEERPERWYTVVAGVLAGISVCFAGSMHYTIFNTAYELKLEGLKKLLSTTKSSYWFPDATRYIGYCPDTNDKTIHEFPCYSFVLGDLHAHVINIMFVLTVLAILYSILQSRRARMDKFRYEGYDSIPGYDIKNKDDRKAMLFREVLTPQIILIGFFIGLFHMTNYWDYPIYFVVSGAIILFSNAVICRFRKETLFLTAAHAFVILAISFIVSLPFKLSFKQISTGIGICTDHSKLYQLVILWGLPASLVIVFLVVMIKRLNASLIVTKKKGKKEYHNPSISKFCDEHPAFDWLYRMINSLEIADLYIITIGLCACGLVLMPELIYVRDIYSGAYKRANTMFKLTYQSYIMFGLCMPYIILRFMNYADKKRQKVFAFTALFFLVTTFGYFFNAEEAWFGARDTRVYKGLDCTVWIKDNNPEDYAAINWINENIEGPAVMLEGVGLSYTYYERISMATGLSTIIGWQTHEWLWRSEANLEFPPVIRDRQNAVKTIYTSKDREAVLAELQKYNVDYIYVGYAERFDGLKNGQSGDEGYEYNRTDGKYYPRIDVNDELLRSLGEVIYQAVDEEGSIYTTSGQYRTYIVKIDKNLYK